jgi:hypothetical protein
MVLGIDVSKDRLGVAIRLTVVFKRFAASEGDHGSMLECRHDNAAHDSEVGQRPGLSSNVLMRDIR